MAVTHISFAQNDGGAGTRLRAMLDKIKAGRQALIDELAIMATMVNGDGTQSSHFPVVTAAYGFGTDANAKAAWDELQSLAGKLTTDGSVSSVNAAQLQAFAKFG